MKWIILLAAAALALATTAGIAKMTLTGVGGPIASSSSTSHPGVFPGFLSGGV